MEKTARDRALAWAQNPYFDPESRQEIQALLNADQDSELTERFYRDLEFGTGGLRSLIGMGSNRINKYTIRKAAQALAMTIQKNFPGQPHKVALSYDCRKFSKEFAEEACAVLAGNKIEAYITEKLGPVPLLSFTVRNIKAQAGIMITASHNPLQYNGLKVYWSDGCQVIQPIDQEIIDNYNSIKDFATIRYLPFNQGLKEGMVHLLEKDINDLYHRVLISKSLNFDLCQSRGKELKIVYSPLHGTGTIPCTRALKELGLTNLLLVEEQANPDSNFSTLSTPPNPEIPEALSMAVNLLRKEKADIAYGTDPDADRLGVVVRHLDAIHYLNGNQVAVLLLHYILTNMKEKGKLLAKPLAIKTIVTTELFTTVAQHFGTHVENTLTGFKWMCSRLRELENQGEDFQFIFASEESYGYLTHDQVRDKDAIAAMSMVSEMALWYKTQGLTLIDALDKIYDRFGFSYEALLSLNFLGLQGAEKIERIMNSFRNALPREICEDRVVYMEDYLLQTKRSLISREVTPLDLPKSNVIGLTLKSGNKIFLRPSGTEPKIKFYIMIQEKEGDLANKKKNALKKARSFEAFLRRKSEEA